MLACPTSFPNCTLAQHTRPLITGEAPQPQPRIVDVEDAPGELKKRAGLTDSQESFFKRLDSNVDSAVADGKPEMATFIEPT
jgi:hypothetical protein